MSTTTLPATTLSRREFLYYVWAASMALFMAEAGGALLWFAVPRFRAGEFGGVFTLAAAEVPPPDADPVAYDGGLDAYVIQADLYMDGQVIRGRIEVKPNGRLSIAGEKMTMSGFSGTGLGEYMV